MICSIHVETSTETAFRAKEAAPGGTKEASDRSNTQFRRHGQLASGSVSVRLPASLLSKLFEANHRTGLSIESLVWDAVDFYLEEKMYEWISTPDATLPGKQAPQFASSHQASMRPGASSRDVQDRLPVSEGIDSQEYVEETEWEILMIEFLGERGPRERPSPR